MKLFHMDWLQNGKYNFEIRDEDIRGTIIKAGYGFNTKQEAKAMLKKELAIVIYQIRKGGK